MGIRKDRYKAMVPQVVAPLRLKGRVHADEARVARTHTARKLKFTLPGPMTIIDTIADQLLRRPRQDGVRLRRTAERGSQGAAGRRRRHDPVRRAGLQRLHGRSPRLGHQGAGARRRRPDLRHRRAHLLRLRHQGQHRLEGRRWAASGGNTRRSFRRSPRARSSRSRSNAAIRRCRWNLLGAAARARSCRPA